MASVPQESTGLLSDQQYFQRTSQPAGPTFQRGLYPVYNDPFTPAALGAADKRSRQRFALTLVLGFLLWLLLGLFVGVVGGEGAWWGDRPYRSRWPGALEPIPEADGNVTYCADFLKTLPTSVIVLPPGKSMHDLSQHVEHAFEEDESNDDNRDAQSIGVIGMKSDGNENWQDDGRSYTIYKSRVFFQLPITENDGLFTIARGHYSAGPIRYIIAEPQAPKHSSPSDGHGDTLETQGLHSSAATLKPAASAKIEVEVTARWNDRELLKSSKVCGLSKHVKSSNRFPEFGVGIYTPNYDYPGQYRHLSFETIVRFPPSQLSKLRSLSLYGPSFAPVDIDLSPIKFEQVHLNTSNGAIRALSNVEAITTNIRTSNGAIEGNFTTSDKLWLQSSNGPIKIGVFLTQDNNKEEKEKGEKQDTPSEQVDVRAHTTNGNAFIHYFEHPVGTKLTSSAKTSNGEAGVTHPPAFEGTFTLSTSWGRGTVRSNSKSIDPSGADRKRNMEITHDQNTFGTVKKEGHIYWGKKWDESAAGESIVQTTLGSASLEFL